QGSARAAAWAGVRADPLFRAIEGHGESFFAKACEAGLEGIISKRADAPYRSGRVGDWLKTKCTLRQEVVIGGWRLSTASPGEIGWLLVGYYDHGKLPFAGGVGTGDTARMRRICWRSCRPSAPTPPPSPTSLAPTHPTP